MSKNDEKDQEPYTSYPGNNEEQAGTEIRIPMSSSESLLEGFNRGRFTRVDVIFVAANGEIDEGAHVVYEPDFKLRLERGGTSTDMATEAYECECLINYPFEASFDLSSGCGGCGGCGV